MFPWVFFTFWQLFLNHSRSRTRKIETFLVLDQQENFVLARICPNELLLQLICSSYSPQSSLSQLLLASTNTACLSNSKMLMIVTLSSFIELSFLYPCAGQCRSPTACATILGEWIPPKPLRHLKLSTFYKKLHPRCSTGHGSTS